ncbi:MAG: hypothetical protein ABI608_10885 [Rhizomicrobium sp.]
MLLTMTKSPYSLNRRRILAAGTASGVLGVSGLSAQIAPNPAASNFKVTVIWNGATYTYPQGPQIPSYYVGFRQDGRIVFHLGALGDLAKAAAAKPEPYHLGPHHVKIERGEAVVFDADIVGHWWNAEWTFRPSPIAAKRTPAQIVAANRMFPFGNTGAKVSPPANYVFKGPMDSAGITLYMPTTGERPDIGLITDASAFYMLGGKPDPMIAWAQAAGSCPMHFRDEQTGKPIDLIRYPKANSYSEPKQGSPWLMSGPPNPKAAGYRQFGGGWTPQQAHYCEMSYLAYVATLDAGFLEDLQYSANFTVLSDGYMSGGRNIATVYGELRGIAWAFRNLFMAHIATKDAEAAGTLPASCHPSSYWKALLDNQLAYYKKYMTDPSNQTFRLVSGGDRFGPWQADYMLTALAFGVLTGHSDWAPFYVWALGNAIARTNGTSGYPPGWGGAYYLNTREWMTRPDGTLDQNQYNPSQPLDWSTTFLYQTKDPNGARPTPAQIDALKSDPLNGGKSMVGAEYLMTTRAVLVMAAYLEKNGLANVRAAYPDLDKCVANVERMVRNNGAANPRTSVIG